MGILEGTRVLTDDGYIKLSDNPISSDVITLYTSVGSISCTPDTSIFVVDGDNTHVECVKDISVGDKLYLLHDKLPYISNPSWKLKGFSDSDKDDRDKGYLLSTLLLGCKVRKGKESILFDGTEYQMNKISRILRSHGYSSCLKENSTLKEVDGKKRRHKEISSLEISSHDILNLLGILHSYGSDSNRGKKSENVVTFSTSFLSGLLRGIFSYDVVPSYLYELTYTVCQLFSIYIPIEDDTVYSLISNDVSISSSLFNSLSEFSYDSLKSLGIRLDRDCKSSKMRGSCIDYSQVRRIENSSGMVCSLPCDVMNSYFVNGFLVQ